MYSISHTTTSAMLWYIIIKMLFNIVDNCEQCGPHNTVQFCFHCPKKTHATFGRALTDSTSFPGYCDWLSSYMNPRSEIETTTTE